MMAGNSLCIHQRSVTIVRYPRVSNFIDEISTADSAL